MIWTTLSCVRLCFLKGFLPIINIPTRVTDSSAKCIDHIWYNRFDITSCGAFVTDISDHYPVFCMFDVSVDSRTVTKKFRDHSVRSLEALTVALTGVADEYNLSYFPNVNTKTEWLVAKLRINYDRYCQIKTKNISNNRISKPWINNNLIAQINRKHSLFKSYKLGYLNFNVYNNYKNNLTKTINYAKRNYYHNKFHQNRKNVRATWSTVNSILNRKKKSSVPSSLIVDDREIGDGTDISNHFCDYFSSIADELDRSIPLSNVDPLSFMPQSAPSSFFVHPTDTTEVLNVVGKLENKSTSLDTIPVFVFKILSPIIAPILSDIFNSSIREGSFPEILKISRVIPIHKSKNHKIVSNFRPISILPTISKVIEKIMKKRVTSFIETNDIICSQQFGFREGYNTVDAALELVDRCTSSLDTKLYTIAIFLDLAKAFDTVNNDIMIRKMDWLGFRGITGQWFRSYLKNRKMYVDINSHHSHTKLMNIGLPQGSVTSPYLFSLYINDFHRCSDKFSFVHFADDTTLYISGDNLQTLCQLVNEELVKVSRWLVANRLSLNTEKTKFILFIHKYVDMTLTPIVIDNSFISRVENIKFLGLTIDQRLNYNEHISQLCKKLSCTVGIIRKMSYYVPHNVLKMLYFSLYYPHLIYGIPIWGGCGATNLGRVSRINNKMCSLFADVPNGNFTPPPLQGIYKYFSLTFFHNFLIKPNHSHYFSHKLLNLRTNHGLNTRFNSSNLISIPRYNKTTSQNQFLYSAIKNYNLLPPLIKDIENYEKFKKMLKVHVFQQ